MNRLALIGIIISDMESVEQINHLLSECKDYIVARLGIPYREKEVSIISIIIDAPLEIISSLAGKLGMLNGVSSKTIYPKEGEKNEKA